MRAFISYFDATMGVLVFFVGGCGSVASCFYCLLFVVTRLLLLLLLPLLLLLLLLLLRLLPLLFVKLKPRLHCHKN